MVGGVRSVGCGGGAPGVPIGLEEHRRAWSEEALEMAKRGAIYDQHSVLEVVFKI